MSHANEDTIMVNENCKIKSGMGGSRCGRSRYAKTEILKEVSKTARRTIDKILTDEKSIEISDAMQECLQNTDYTIAELLEA